MNLDEKDTTVPSPVKGYLCIALHAHLPFVRHPENEYMLEENWLFEALTETYLPLLSTLMSLAEDRVPCRMTVSLSPTLCTMFTDTLLQERYVRHLERLIALAKSEVKRTASHPDFSRTAAMYFDQFRHCRWLYEEVLARDVVKAFKNMQDLGIIEIITCGATHAFLPNMQGSPRSIRAQLRIAAGYYRKLFGREVPGMWLPECGYFPGLETVLHEEGIRYFFVDTHGILHAKEKPRYGVYAPLVCTKAPVAAFGRDTESSHSVWSADEGYPGDPHYREFYRDIGFDLDIDYIKPYIDPAGIRVQTGIKYYRVTDKANPEKQPYRRLDALRMAEEHAGNFMYNRELQIRRLSALMDRPPLIVAPYDAELFGHWWYEGIEWLNFLIRKIAFEQNRVTLVTPSDYLQLHPENQSSDPSFSSWGEGGFSMMWLNESNDWIYRHLTRMEERMTAFATANAGAEGLLKRALNQMARELLLAQSSDWAFIMKSGTMVDYAIRRTKEHIANFLRLCEDIEARGIDEGYVGLLEASNNVFPDIDYSIYGEK
jgi:1,4-alpha-glucan branching enzyme